MIHRGRNKDVSGPGREIGLESGLEASGFKTMIDEYLQG